MPSIKPISWPSLESFSPKRMPLKPGRWSAHSFQEAALKIHATPQRHYVACGKFPSPPVPPCQPPNLRGCQQWSCRQPAQRLCRLSNKVRSLPSPVTSPFHCSLNYWNMCGAWDVLEAGRPNGELAAPSHLGAEAPLIWIP